jgi:hypothetical protein
MSQVDPTLKINSLTPVPVAHPRKRIGPRAALIAGFSALLVLMAILALDAIRSLHELEVGSSQVRQGYLNRERTLRKIRASVYNSGNLLREYSLSDSRLQLRESYLERLHDMWDHASAAMESCIRELPPNLQEPLRRLANQLQSYWLAADQTSSDGLHESNQAILHQPSHAYATYYCPHHH